MLDTNEQSVPVDSGYWALTWLSVKSAPHLNT